MTLFWHIEGRKCFCCNMQECSFLCKRARGMVGLCRNGKVKNIYTQMCKNDKWSNPVNFNRKAKSFKQLHQFHLPFSKDPFLSSGWHCLAETVWLTATLRLSRSSLRWQGEGWHTARACIRAGSSFQRQKYAPVCKLSRVWNVLTIF